MPVTHHNTRSPKKNHPRFREIIQKHRDRTLNAIRTSSKSPALSPNPPTDTKANPPPLPPTRPAARAPKSGSEILKSEYRPHVVAEDRIYAWDTPYARCHRSKLGLPPGLISSSFVTLMGALAPNTRSTYAAGILRFTQFCDKYGVSEEERMPASYALLTGFMSEWSGKKGDGTIRGWLAGVRAWHQFHHAPWFGDDSWVQLARSCVAKEGQAFRKPPRSPVSMEHLIALRRTLRLSDPFHAAVWAAATAAFFGCRRLAEIVVAVKSKFSPKYNVCRSCEPRFRTHRDGSSAVAFDIPWTKTTKERGALVVLTARTDKWARELGICPVKAMKNHLAVNHGLPLSASLFAYRSGNSWKHLTRAQFLEHVMGIWRSAGLGHVSGHSFRIGGAVELLLAGVPPEIVASTGGWTSLAFLLYWRRVEEVLPMSTTRAYHESQLKNSLAAIFEKFRRDNNLPEYLSTTAQSLRDTDHASD
ncbi:hypothetical protein CC1G_08508 [Coprinopsis cinerea okayama7|uniref:Tyr recombinase domain-containing protein n=2 Tax=Coprinopsis cinerea TaxID=5346 RepID=A8ND20_COPC7|nr:hypothetical protein CC1G_08508 [Coprinopsis cinerea okayama7\|eukprot:XP_001832680.1 hypothetical protein CC1G_08508 [Coprinopsis cinerea okayama7\